MDLDKIPNIMTKERLAQLLRDGATYRDFSLVDGRLYYNEGPEDTAEGASDPKGD